MLCRYGREKVSFFAAVSILVNIVGAGRYKMERGDRRLNKRLCLKYSVGKLVEIEMLY